MSKVLQILPRETQKTSSPTQKISSPNIAASPKIVDITSVETQTSTAAKNTTTTQTVPDKKIENKTVETETELRIADKKR